METLLEEARKLAAGGVRELIVIAQDTTYYGLDLYGKRRLAELLEALCRIDGIRWIRLHYAYPTAFPDEVIEVMAREPENLQIPRPFPSSISPTTSSRPCTDAIPRPRLTS